jgi:hypothetical protein
MDAVSLIWRLPSGGNHEHKEKSAEIGRINSGLCGTYNYV